MSEFKPYGPTRVHHPSRLLLRHVAAPQWSGGCRMSSCHVMSKAWTHVRVTRVSKKSATWQPMVGATCQTESGRVEKRQTPRTPEVSSGRPPQLHQLRVSLHQRYLKKPGLPIMAGGSPCNEIGSLAGVQKDRRPWKPPRRGPS